MDPLGTPAVANAETDSEALHPGEIVQGKYLVQRIVGVGGMCVVGAATNVLLEQVVALKVLRRALSQNNEMVVRFMREARSAARLKSEHVARVFDVSVLDTGEPFMVMEYLEGRDLGVMLDGQGVLPLSEAAEYVLQACEAIGEAHAAGLVHRDLKPENLFLTHRADGEPHIKVLDFGIAKAIQPSEGGRGVSSLTQENATFGTPTYMSPEQLREARDVDARSDIFSLGVLLYELTTGRVPFEGNSTAELHASILMEEPCPVHELDAALPPEFSEVVARALAKERHERFQSVAELASELVAFAPPRAQQYAERVARVVSAQPAAVLTIEGAGRNSPTPPGPVSVTGRHRRVVRSPSPAPIRLTPTSDPVRLSLTGQVSDVLGAADLAADPNQTATLAPPPPGGSSRRGLWIASGAGGVALVCAALGWLLVVAPMRAGHGASPSGRPDPVPSASAVASPGPSASASAEAPAAAQAPSASASGPAPLASASHREPVRAAPPAKATKASKPAPKPDEFDPFGKRK